LNREEFEEFVRRNPEEALRLIVKAFKPKELLKIGNRSYANAFKYPESRFDPKDLMLNGGSLQVLKGDMLQPLRDPSKSFTDQVLIPPSQLVFSLAGRTYSKSGMPETAGMISGGLTDASTVIQQALDSLTSKRDWDEKVVLRGVFDLSKTITVPSHTVVEVDGKLIAKGNFPIFKIDYSWFVNIRGGFLVGYGNTDPNSMGIYVRLSEKVTVRDVTITNCYYGLYIDGIYQSLFDNINMAYIPNFGKNNIGVKTSGAAGRINEPTLSNIIVSSLSHGFMFDYANGLATINCGAVYCGGHGFYFYGETAHDMGNVNMLRVVADGCSGDGIRLEAGNATRMYPFQITDYWCTGCLNGISILNAYQVTLVNPQIFRVKRHGFYANKTRRSVVVGGRIIWVGNEAANTYDCINLDGQSEENAFMGVVLDVGPNGRYCINEVNGWENFFQPALIKGSISALSQYSRLAENIVPDGKFTRKTGVATFSGDGSTTTFNIPHRLSSTPTKYIVTPLTPDAHASKTITVDATNIVITFATAPPAGTNNLKFGWYAEV